MLHQSPPRTLQIRPKAPRMIDSSTQTCYRDYRDGASVMQIIVSMRKRNQARCLPRRRKKAQGQAPLSPQVYRSSLEGCDAAEAPPSPTLSSLASDSISAACEDLQFLVDAVDETPETTDCRQKPTEQTRLPFVFNQPRTNLAPRALTLLPLLQDPEYLFLTGGRYQNISVFFRDAEEEAEEECGGSGGGQLLQSINQ